MTAFRAAERTDVGRVRDANQDLAFVADDLFIVADGMGGHNGGEIAAQVAVETVRDTFTMPTVDALVGAVQVANEAVVARADSDPELHGMGTTICVVASISQNGDDTIGVASVGDSRVYLLAGDELVQITRDHTLVQMLVDQGQLSESEAGQHPQRNILTRALGIDQRVMVDLFLLRPVTGDRYLICSDGLFGEVDDGDIVEVLRSHPDPGEAADVLVGLANDNGGRDNITCVVVDVVDGLLDSDPDSDRLIVSRTGAAAVLHPAEVRPGAAADGPADDTAAHEPAVDEPAVDEPAPHEPAPHEPDVDGRAVDEVIEPETAPALAPDTGDGGRRGGGGRGKGRAARAAAGPSRSRDEARTHRPRRVTWRALLFVLLVLASLAAAAWAVTYYARNTFYVAVDDQEVVIYRGRPGGVLWFSPTLEERTGLDADDLTGAAREDLRGGKDQPTIEDARAYVERLREQLEERAGRNGASPGSTTTTTAGGPGG